MPGESVRPGREQPNPGRPAFAGERGEVAAGDSRLCLGRGCYGGRAAPRHFFSLYFS